MITVTIPLRTCRGPNEREGWRAKAKRTKSERNVAYWYLYDAAGGPGRVAAEVGVTITLTRAGPTNGLDDDNLRGSLKAVRDGVADWLGSQDNDKRLTWAYQQRRESKWSVSIAVTPSVSATSSSPGAPASSASTSSAAC